MALMKVLLKDAPASVKELAAVSTRVNKHLEARYAVGKVVGKTFIPSVHMNCAILDFSENITFSNVEEARAFRQQHTDYRIADVRELTEWHNKYVYMPIVRDRRIAGMGLMVYEEN